MAATEAQIVAFVRASGRNWKNICQALVYQICNRFGVANKVYSSATAARLDSNIRSKDARQAPPGAIHYWDYWATIGGIYANYGHDGVDTRGGGVGVMSTGKPTQIGNGAAIIDFVSWTNQMGKSVKYLGWALSNGQNAVTIIPSGSPSGGGDSPAPEPEPELPEEEEDMARPFFITHPGYLFLAAGTVGGGVKHLQPGDVDIISGGTPPNQNYWLLSDGTTLATGIPTFDTKGNQAALDALLALYGATATAPAAVPDATVFAKALKAELGSVGGGASIAEIEAALKKIKFIVQ